METPTHFYNEYIAGLFAPQDPALTATLTEMRRENIPSMNVSAVEGKLLQLLALTVGAKRVLEIGTLGGYSGIHFVRALPADGKLITLELDPHHAEVARRNFDQAGIGQQAEIRVGPALESLQEIAASDEALFDVIFIDADKDNYTEYLNRSLPLLREGGLVLGDNTLRITPGHEDPGTMAYNAAVAQRPELTTILIPILRQHGMDGLTVSFKRTPTT
jgi:predicted O-methyltransferase YrrM